MATIINFDHWRFSEGESLRSLVTHGAYGLSIPNHNGWHLRPDVHEWFVKNEIDYAFWADWDMHKNQYCFYVSTDNEDNAVLAKLRWK